MSNHLLAAVVLTVAVLLLPGTRRELFGRLPGSCASSGRQLPVLGAMSILLLPCSPLRCTTRSCPCSRRAIRVLAREALKA